MYYTHDTWRLITITPADEVLHENHEVLYEYGIYPET